MRYLLAAALLAFGCGSHAHGVGDIDSGLAPDASDDFDGDGLTNEQEGCGPNDVPARDTDMDGVPDCKDTDSDNDGYDDASEGLEDWDNDGVPNYIDGFNDGPAPTLTFVAISVPFPTPIGIDFHEPTHSIVMSVNYGAGGVPYNFERIEADGTEHMFSTYSGLTDEVKIATARSGNPAGWDVGTLFTGNGIEGQIVKISADGSQISNPWVSLPGVNNGLMRGGLYVDRTGVWNGDLLIVTDSGEIWRIDKQGNPTQVSTPKGVHLEGVISVPNNPTRFGPLAGKLIAGAEQQGDLWVISPNGDATTVKVGCTTPTSCVNIEDIDIVNPGENFFGVNFGTNRLLGVTAAECKSMVGDILLTQENVTAGTSGLWRLHWNPTTQALEAQPIQIAPGSATIGQWEHTTFANASVVEIQ